MSKEEDRAKARAEQERKRQELIEKWVSEAPPLSPNTIALLRELLWPEGVPQPTGTWGVMFADGSVMHPWNGRTQRQRAEEELALLREQWRLDNVTLAHKVNGKWQRYPRENS